MIVVAGEDEDEDVEVDDADAEEEEPLEADAVVPDVLVADAGVPEDCDADEEEAAVAVDVDSYVVDVPGWLTTWKNCPALYVSASPYSVILKAHSVGNLTISKPAV